MEKKIKNEDGRICQMFLDLFLFYFLKSQLLEIPCALLIQLILIRGPLPVFDTVPTSEMVVAQNELLMHQLPIGNKVERRWTTYWCLTVLLYFWGIIS